MELTDIHDIKALVKFGINPALFWYVALVFLALGMMAAGIAYWKKRQTKAAPIIASISPEDAALDQIDSLKPLTEAQGKAFYFELSIILREYIWRRFGVGAPEMTTEELLPKVAELDIDGRLVQELRGFARASDPVKFADKPAQLSEMEHHIGFVRSFVIKTTPATPIDVETPPTGIETMEMELNKT